MPNAPTMTTEEQQQNALYAVVRILDVPYHVDRPYTYLVPVGLSAGVFPGCFVLVPFGGGNRPVMGVVQTLTEEPPRKKDGSPAPVKPVVRGVSEEFFLTGEMLGLCEYLRSTTFCTFGDAAKTVVPAGALRHLTERYSAVSAETVRLFLQYPDGTCTERLLFDEISRHAGIRLEKLEKQFGEDCISPLRKLCKQGFLTRETLLTGGENAVMTTYVRAVIPKEDLSALAKNSPEARKKYGFRRRAEGFLTLFSALAASEDEEISEETLAKAGVPAACVKNAAAMGFIALRKEPFYRNPYKKAAKTAPKDKNVLTEEQENARRTLSALYRTHEPRAALLYGVTGSGKTRVIKAMMDEVIADGRQVIMLVPEISLTPQSVSVFCAYYGERVAVIHSGLSAGERLDVFRRVRGHEVDLVIGTRSAVFAPFDNLGMLVIDEEQEHTYKSDTAPRYHARDAARWRCAKNNALLLLASATPSFESYYKAKQGIYTLVELKNRYNGAALPEVVFADLHNDADGTGEVPLGTTLSTALRRTADAGEQAILFVNRRGYQRYLACLSCHAPVSCPHCSVPMTLHQSAFGKNGDMPRETFLVCHYCGAQLKPPALCPACGSEHMRAFGYGTQRAEEALAVQFPDAARLRMDMDTTQGKFAHEEILGRFRRHEAGILLGTQMVTKGHDFPDVTLVGVLNADALLFGEDYRASERTFSLLTQVIGRAGRAEKKGIAVIQTYDPENEVLKFAAAQDYPAFYESAIGMRRALTFPPFCELAVFSFSGEDEAAVIRAAGETAERLKALWKNDYPDVKLGVFGPFEAQIYRVMERYRMRMLVKCRMNRRTRELFSALLGEFSAKRASGVILSLDINPTNL